MSFNTNITEQELNLNIERILENGRKTVEREDALATIFSCLDLTTLEGTDNEARIVTLCHDADTGIKYNGRPLKVAAVCVYPSMLQYVKKHLGNPEIKVASVAGGFPASQTALFIKMAEVRYALDEGADEIDMVLSQGMFLEGRFREVSDEITGMKAMCQSKHLKVILETGALGSIENIYKASTLAIEAGADFIKTSTGKIQEGASLRSVYTMLHAIKEHHEATSKMIGLKPAGGISDPDTALDYYHLVKAIVGDKWLNNHYFRIGASRLAKRIGDSIGS